MPRSYRAFSISKAKLSSENVTFEKMLPKEQVARGSQNELQAAEVSLGLVSLTSASLQ